MTNKLSFIIQVIFVSILVWLLTTLLFTNEFIFNSGDDESAQVDTAEVSDGTFTGSAEGHNDQLTLDVTVENGEISQIDVTEHSETEGISDPAFEQVPEQIIESNSTDVEIVSGATFTSEAIINAVNNALAEDSGGSSEAIALEDVSDGTYTGTSEGHNGLMTVDVTVENQEITDINVVSHLETEGLSDPAFDQVPDQIIDSNSLDVEIVSGATFTSEAIIEAINDALSQN